MKILHVFCAIAGLTLCGVSLPSQDAAPPDHDEIRTLYQRQIEIVEHELLSIEADPNRISLAEWAETILRWSDVRQRMVRTADDRIAIAEEAVAKLDSIVEVAHMQVEAGRAAAFDALKVEYIRNEARIALLELQQRS